MKAFAEENVKDFTARGVGFTFIHHEGKFEGWYDQALYEISYDDFNMARCHWRAERVDGVCSLIPDKWSNDRRLAFAETPLEAVEKLFVELEKQLVLLQRDIPPKENKMPPQTNADDRLKRIMEFHNGYYFTQIIAKALSASGEYGHHKSWSPQDAVFSLVEEVLMLREALENK